MRRIIQLIIGIFLSIVGVPSKEGLVSIFAKELLCDPNIGQCALGIIIATGVFVVGLVATFGALIELFDQFH